MRLRANTNSKLMSLTLLSLPGMTEELLDLCMYPLHVKFEFVLLVSLETAHLAHNVPDWLHLMHLDEVLLEYLGKYSLVK